MTASLLAALGLPVPARGLPAQAPSGPRQPTGPIRAPSVEPRDELPARRQPAQDSGTSQPPGGSVPTNLRMRPDPVGTGGLPPNLRPKDSDGGSTRKSNEPSDAEIANAKAAFEKTQLKGAEQLAAVVARIGEKQRRDPLVAVLRDGLARIEPFVSKQDFKTGLHAALDELASKGLEKGFVKLIELAIGKTAGEVTRPDTSVPPPGTKPDEAPGEHIVTKDIPFGDDKGSARFVFEGVPARVAPGQSMIFKVRTPARWSLNNKRWQNTRVVVAAKGSGPKGTALPSAPFRNKGANEVKLTAPDVLGMYVLYIEAAGIRETSPEYDFEVSAGQGASRAAADALPARSEGKADAGDDKTAAVELTIENASDASLLLVEEYLTRLSFDGVIPSALAPGRKVTLEFFMPEVTSDVLLYAAVPAGLANVPKDAPTWQIQCRIEPGGKLDGSSDIGEASGLKGAKTSDGKGKILFKLSGKLQATPAAATRLGLAIDNQSDRPLRLVSADNDGGRFDPPPPAKIAPKKRANFASLGSGAKGGTLLYELEVTAGPIVSPEQLVGWTMSWAPPAQPGQAPQPDSTLAPELNGFSAFAAAGADSIVYKLVGATAAKTPGAAVTKHLDLTIDNQSDRTLRLVEAGNDGGHFDPAPPAEIAPKKKSAFAAVDTGAKGGTLVYELQVAEGPVVSPDQLVSWKMSWSPPAKAGQPQKPDSTLDPELKGFSPSAAGGKGSVAFMLAGTSAAATQPGSSASPAAGQRRIDITFINQSDQHLKYWGADKMKVTFEQKPPDTLKPGASASFAIVAKGADEIAFGLMYSIVAKSDAKADANTPMWTPHFTVPAGTTVMVAGSDVVPDIVGLKSSENAGTDAVSFVLSGKTVASAQQPGAGAELRIPITFTNDSNMVLRYFGADKMALAFEGKPPEVIKPGQSLAFTVRGKRDSDIHFGLMYSILASEAETGDKDTPKWMPQFDLPQGSGMIAVCNLDRGTDGLGAAGRSEKGGAIFSLSGKWTKENQELKTRISIENTTRYKLRLVQSSAAPGRFEPTPPAEIAPGTTVVCASWAKVESVQKAVYELEAAEGAAGAEKGSRKPRRWTIGWHTKPKGFPVPDSQVENIELRGGDWQIYDIDLVRFKLDIKSDAKRK